MKVALPVWNGRVSPVFDAAQRILVVEIKDGRELARAEAALVENFIPNRVRRIKELGVDVLLCGAISRPLAGMLMASGVRVVPFVTGTTDEILAAYLSGRIHGPEFLMPGCCGRRLGFRGGRIAFPRTGRGGFA